MTTFPPGVLVRVTKTSERCGKCNQAFIMETYLEPLTEKRHHRILCKNCNIIIPVGED